MPGCLFRGAGSDPDKRGMPDSQSVQDGGPWPLPAVQGVGGCRGRRNPCERCVKETDGQAGVPTFAAALCGWGSTAGQALEPLIERDVEWPMVSLKVKHNRDCGRLSGCGLARGRQVFLALCSEGGML